MPFVPGQFYCARPKVPLGPTGTPLSTYQCVQLNSAFGYDIAGGPFAKLSDCQTFCVKAKPNTFGTFPVYDAREVRDNRDAYRYDEVPELDAANSLFVSGGRWPARGWVLMKRSDYNQLNTYSYHNLVIQGYQQKGTGTVFLDSPITLRNLAIVQARCVSRGVAADPNALYLIELTDPRGIVWNEWSKFPTQSQYNIRAPAYPELFYSQSNEASGAWSWSDMIGDLWGQMGTWLGVYPGLPSDANLPANTPEGWSFPGVSGWEALCYILDYLGLAVAVDLQQQNPYTIATLGGIDTPNTANFAKYAPNLEDDWEYIDTGVGRVPLQVRVFFHRRNQFYGTEETVRRDSLQWSSTPAYSVTVAGPFPNATGIHTLWADYTVEFDPDNNPLASSVATANSVAQNVATNYFNRITRSTLGFLKRQYTGALPFATGGLVDGVAWRQDKRTSDRSKGWVTTIIRGPDPPFYEVDYAD